MRSDLLGWSTSVLHNLSVLALSGQFLHTSPPPAATTHRTELSDSMDGTQVLLWHPHNKYPSAQDKPWKCLWEHTQLLSRMVSLLDKNYTNYCRAQNSINVLNTVPHQFVPATHCNITAMFHCLKACSSPQHLWVLCICFPQKTRCTAFEACYFCIINITFCLTPCSLSSEWDTLSWYTAMSFFTAVKLLDVRHGPWPLFFPPEVPDEMSALKRNKQ